MRELLVENPSSQMIIVQAVLLSDYPNPESIIQLIKMGFHINWSENELESVETKPKSFLLANLTSDHNIHQNIKQTFGVNPHVNSLTFLMPAFSKNKISIQFSPQDDSSLASTILLLRNNLTILDAIFLQGQGGNAILKIANQLPGENSVLTFDLLEKHLKSCSKTKHPNFNSIEPSFTVHRTFTATNIGKLLIKIRGFSIGQNNNQLGCQGYGFKVINCGEFELRPNENKKIHIAFTPDFTQSKVKQYIQVVTDDPRDDLKFVLVANLPKNLISVCSQSIARPNWEEVLYYCLVTIMSFMILLAICIAYFDGDRVLNYSFYPVLTTYAINYNENNSIVADDDHSEKIKSNCNDNNKRLNELRQRKPLKSKTNRTNSAGKEEEFKPLQGQTWAQFLKRKLVRRDSSGSEKSNTSLKSTQINSQKFQALQFDIKKDILTDEKNKTKSKKVHKVNDKCEIDNKIGDNKIGKKRLNAPLKFENLTNVISSPPPPLPTFPSSFDDDFIKNLKPAKKSKSNNLLNNIENEQNSLELPYKPSKSNLNSVIKTNKKPKSKEKLTDDNDSCNSSNENSITWDQPLNNFDSGKIDNLNNYLTNSLLIFFFFI